MIVVVGLGATGARIATTLASTAEVGLVDPDESTSLRVADRIAADTGAAPVLGTVPSLLGSASVIVAASPVGTQYPVATSAVGAGVPVVTTSDDPTEVRRLLSLDARAVECGVRVVVGAGFAPGLSCVLARFGIDRLDEVDEIAVAKVGTAGPACARQHHRAMQLDAPEWFEGEWIARRAGGGRDLAWFPPPTGAHDCYRAALPSPLLLHRVVPEARRLTARVSATRRDRLTSRLPMLRPPHPDGGPGAIRVEVRGRRDGRFETLVYGVSAFPSAGAAAVAAEAARAVGEGLGRPGAWGLAELDRPGAMLRRLAEAGVRTMTLDDDRMMATGAARAAGRDGDSCDGGHSPGESTQETTESGRSST